MMVRLNLSATGVLLRCTGSRLGVDDAELLECGLQFVAHVLTAVVTVELFDSAWRAESGPCWMKSATAWANIGLLLDQSHGAHLGVVIDHGDEVLVTPRE